MIINVIIKEFVILLMVQKMKVLLALPSWSLFPEDLPSVVPPLGIAYIAAVLEKNDVDVKILDAIALEQESRINKDGKIHFGMSWNKIKE